MDYHQSQHRVDLVGLVLGLMLVFPNSLRLLAGQWDYDSSLARDEYWEERWEPDTFDEGLEEELAEDYAAELTEEAYEDLDVPSMYYDGTDQGQEFLGEAYGYPYGPAHPHAPVNVDEDPGAGGQSNYYTHDWFEDGSEFDAWYDDDWYDDWYELYSNDRFDE